MSAPGDPAAPTPPGHPPRALDKLLGLLAAPALTAAGLAIAPRLSLPEAAAAGIVFAGAAAAALLALTAAAPAAIGPRAAIALGAGGGALLGVVALAAPRPAIAVVIVNLALVAIAHAVGGSIGRRVAHPGHLLPACAVAAAADVASALHPAGPTHTVVESERALSLLAVGFAVPGTRAVAPALGAGDLVFIALVLGVAVTHRLSIPRAAAAAAAGLAAAGLLSARLDAAIPALVPIGAAVVAGVPAARRLRPEDRRTAVVAVAAAAAVVAGVLLSPR